MIKIQKGSYLGNHAYKITVWGLFNTLSRLKTEGNKPTVAMKPLNDYDIEYMATHRLNLKKLLLFIGDIGFLYLSLLVTLFVRAGQLPNNEVWKMHLGPFSIIYGIWLIVFYIGDLYEPQQIPSRRRLLERLVKLQAVNAVISIIFFYLIPYFGIAPKTTLVLDLFIAVLFLYFWKILLDQLLGKTWLGEKAAVINITPEAKEIIETLNQTPHIGYRVVAAFRTGSNNSETALPIPTYSLDALPEKMASKEISVVIGSLSNGSANHIDALYNGIFEGLKFYDTASFYENITGKVPLALLQRAWFLENISGNIKRPYDLLKRVIDIAASAVLGAITLAFLPFAALVIKMTDNGPVFFRQKRVGQGGHVFELIKFRTMKPNAEQNGPQFAKENDPRVTKIGRWLRLTRLDELPQVWNILKGDLSLVGPRPERPEFVKEFEEKIPFYQIRHLVKPGLSGWAQLNFEYADNLEGAYKKLQYELYYIKNRSLLLDLSIILKTINLMLSRAGR